MGKNHQVNFQGNEIADIVFDKSLSVEEKKNLLPTAIISDLQENGLKGLQNFQEYLQGERIKLALDIVELSDTDALEDPTVGSLTMVGGHFDTLILANEGIKKVYSLLADAAEEAGRSIETSPKLSAAQIELKKTVCDMTGQSERLSDMKEANDECIKKLQKGEPLAEGTAAKALQEVKTAIERNKGPQPK
jgi:hypothetical protein